jgi:hypothetical protein
LVAVLIGGRVALEPRPAPSHVIALTSEQRVQASASLAASAVDRRTLVAAVAATRVVLVGESHFVEEPITWLCGLLDELHAAHGRRAVLVLELLRRGGADIDRYFATGDEEALGAAFGWGALPYQRIVRWARAHPEAVAGVVAADENPWHSGVMRLFLTDTRNDTMARAVAAAAQTGSARVVAYGGALHMMKSGRYLYDSDTRRPMGARLPALGIPVGDTAVVWLFAGDPPGDGAWEQPGAVVLAGKAGDLALAQIEEARIFGATRFGDIVDYAVYLGPATSIANH